MSIPDAKDRISQYPHQFSGGMRQRIMMAMASSCDPDLLIDDESTTAVDVTTQAQVLEIFRNMVKSLNTSLMIVTHNLGVVARYTQRIYVMYAGRFVDSVTARDIFNNPLHPYIIGLLNSFPMLDEPKGRKLVQIEGLPPDLSHMPRNCAFAPSGPSRSNICREKPWPELRLVDGQHYVACDSYISQKRVVDLA
ncbi:oligopeptide/dipeptide ABC transporter ATP-binding protein [Thermodesulfobacteriota bacterium]